MLNFKYLGGILFQEACTHVCLWVGGWGKWPKNPIENKTTHKKTPNTHNPQTTISGLSAKKLCNPLLTTKTKHNSQNQPIVTSEVK